ncbi:MAG TPA: LPS export ABC transporter permease LptF [Gammaproteobacteria bacterium]|nr:LPS export ABC transporter permease LptF [Gammaproteobacteria bacterium]
MIISRYLTKEVFGTLIAVTFILLLIFLSNQLVRYLSYAASGKIAASILLQLMGFMIPYLLALLLPLGLYLGIILAYGRLYADNEMRVMQIGGFSTAHLLKITIAIAIAITLVVLVLMLWVNPLIAREREQLIAQHSATDAFLETLLPGRFQQSSDGRRVIYVERISRNHKKAQNLFIAEQKQEELNTNWVVLSAAEGFQMQDPLTQDRFMVATDGYRYEGTPGQNDYKIIQFKKYAVRAQNIPISSRHHEQEILPTKTLWQYAYRPASAAELQWRFSIPLSVLLLAFLAIPLSQVQPRQGRYAHLFPAILIYVVYINLLFVARNWIEQGTLPAIVGMWWVHVLLFAFAAFLFVLQSDFRFKNWIRKWI